MTDDQAVDGDPDRSAPPWLALGPSETILWRDTRRTRAILPTVGGAVPFLLAGLALVVFASSSDEGPVLVGLGAVLVALTLGVVVLQYRSIRNTEYVATDERLYRKQGILSLRVTTVDYETVQNVTYSQTVTGRFFDHGSLAFDTAGGSGTELTFDDIDDPRPVESLVNERLSQARGESRDTVPGSVEQWEAVLREVRSIGDTLERN
jgi:uncharacterized membrane protein YdbT with pleckstrin-like domain